MPTLRPFRALRYALEAEADLSALICPPYDVISADQRARLESRHPHNAVHLELPAPAAESAHAGSEAASPYLRAARDFVAWRTQGVLRKDPRPAIYAYEQVYRQTGEPDDRRLRGFFARLRLEVAGPDSGVRPHERTLSGPKEDRYRLLRACGANFSPVVMLFGSGRRSQPLLEAACRGQPTANALDDTGVRHRLWRLEAPSGKDPEDPNALVGERLLALGQAGPLVIADGHHRYETALRYRDERGERRACESDPAYDYVLALLFDLDDPALAVLATHRLVRGGPVGEGLLKAADELFEVRPLAGRHELIAAFPPGARNRDGEASRRSRFGVYSGGRAALLTVRPAAFAALPSRAESGDLRLLDVELLAESLWRLFGIDPDATAVGGRVSYTKDAAEALARIDGGAADTAFLLDPTPVAAVATVAMAGEVMPQKSTYFYPKAATGFVFNPLEP